MDLAHALGLEYISRINLAEQLATAQAEIKKLESENASLTARIVEQLEQLDAWRATPTVSNTAELMLPAATGIGRMKWLETLSPEELREIEKQCAVILGAKPRVVQPGDPVATLACD